MPEPSSYKKAFSTVSDCLRVLTTMESSGRLRSADRAMIHAQMDGRAPYTPKEVEDNNIQFNVNKLGGYKIAIDADMQVNGALMNKDLFFTCTCVKGDKEKRDEWAQRFTENINEPMKKGKSGKKHLYLMMNRNASLVMDGTGAMVWMNNYNWMPRFIPLQDLLIPEDTGLDLSEGLGHFAFNVYYTPWQLNKLVSGDKVDKGWNVPFVRQIIASIPQVTNSIPGMRETWAQPEVWEQIAKQHSTFLSSDVAGKVKLTFLFEQDEDTGKWFRKVLYRKTDNVSLPDGSADSMAPDDNSKFMYDSGTTPFADDIEQIMTVQFGAGNVVAPLKFHSTRGLGTLLYAAVEADNRLYNQTLQATFFDLMQIFRIQNPTQQDRPKIIDLHAWGELEDGVSFIKSDERHTPDKALLESTIGQNRQLIADSSASYTSDLDNGTQREQTLGEAQIKLQAANKMVSGLLGNIYWQELYYYEEVKRRMLMRNPTDRDIQNFQAKCKAAGIPDDMMHDPTAWVLDVEKVFGAGDQTLAIQEVTALMAIVSQLDPSAQLIVRRKYIATITRNPDLARQLVPDDPNASSSGRQAAEDVFGTLMEGIAVSLREGITQQDYVITMAEMMAAKIEQIKNLDDVGTPRDVVGLQTVEADIMQHIQLLSQDPAMKPLVAGMTKEVGKMMNEVKAFAQRQQQKAQAEAEKENQPDPMIQAKTEALAAQTAAKLHSQEVTTAQKLKDTHLKTQQDLAAKDEKHQQEMRQSAEQHIQDVAQQAAQTEADLASNAAKTQIDIQTKKIQQRQALVTPKKTSQK